MTPSARVLVADDEPAIVMAVESELRFEGYEVHTSSSGPEAVTAGRALWPDVLLLDLMLPGLNGYEVSRTLRAEQPSLWIIMLTVRGHEADRLTGFEAGADDYVTKPFSLRELVSRIKVGLRRRSAAVTGPLNAFGAIQIDLAARRVSRSGKVIDLTPKEFEILALLARRAGEAITRDEFLDAVWGRDIHVTHRTVDTHIFSLRRKLETDPDRPVHILGVRTVGYRLETGLSRS